MIPTNFKYLDFPQVPESIIDDIKGSIKDLHSLGTTHTFQKFKIDSYQIDKIENTYPIDDSFLGLAGDVAVTQYPDLATFIFTKASDNVHDWCRKNILENCTVHIQYFFDGKFFLPHVDLIRNRAYNYLIETGNASTCFWNKRAEYNHLTATPNTFIPYDRIELAEELVIEKNKWHELSVDKIHSVENLNGSRLSISISLVDNPNS